MKSKLYICVWVAVLITGLLFLGCSTTNGPAIPQPVQDYICNPPPAVVSIAAAALGLVIPGSAAASAVDLILKGACVTIPELNALIAFIQGVEQEAKVTGAKAAPGLSSAPLIKWRDRK